MTVKQLIDELLTLDPDMIVVLQKDEGCPAACVLFPVN